MSVLLAVAIIGVGLIVLGAFVRNIRREKGFNLAYGGFNMLYISMVLVSIGVYML